MKLGREVALTKDLELELTLPAHFKKSKIKMQNEKFHPSPKLVLLRGKKCKILENPRRILPRIQKNISLKNYTTFKIGGKAKYFFEAETKNDLIKAVEAAVSINLPFFILGAGSNVLVSDEAYKGLVIKMQNEKFHPSPKLVLVRGKKCKIIYVEAGTKLDDLIQLTIKESLAGLEWAAGVPGTLGGAIRGNTGAFEESMAASVKSVEALEINPPPLLPRQKWWGVKNFTKKDCQFSYRESIFKKNPNLIILSAEVLFQKGDEKKIKQKIKENLDYRKKRHPLNFPSAGSIFKNPAPVCLNKLGWGKSSQISAAELIDKAGLKGKKIGKAQVSKKHCNFIINLGGAKAKDVKKLIDLIKQKVKEKFKITLEEEVEYFNF